jgi:apolipoprotein N-acyltransferase
VDVRIVQTNIPLDQPWEGSPTKELLDELEDISAAPSQQHKLIVWPETPAPFLLNEDPEFRSRIQRIAQRSGAHVLLGYIDRIKESPSNSAALVDPEGRIVSRYDKIRLVPFGEYIPMKDLLFFAETFTRQVGDFAPGSDYTLSAIDGHRFSTAICYESIFPDFVRQFVKNGSQLIVVITNDGWFGESSAPFQHLRMGVVRAVENRRYIVRSANTGISAIIDPYGRILAETPLGVRTVLEGTAMFRSDQTFYSTYGDVFAYGNVAAVAVAVLLFLRKGAGNVRRTHRKIR